MKVLTVGSLTAAAAVLLLATSSLAEPHPKVTFKMFAQNGSGESGIATLTDLEGRTRVQLDLENENATGDQPTHIHLGSCKKLNPAPKYPLKSLILGHSNTIVDVPMSQLMGHKMAINVHESTKELGKYVSCGKIP